MIPRVSTVPELLQTLRDGAYAAIINRPATREALDEVVHLFGDPSGQIFADYRLIMWLPESKDSLATSREAHPLHMDGTFMDEPPAIFILQVIRTDGEDSGKGLFLSMSEILEAMPDDMKALLMSQRLIFRRKREGSDEIDTYEGQMLFRALDGEYALNWRYDRFVHPEIPAGTPEPVAAALEPAIQWIKDYTEHASLTEVAYQEGDIIVVRNLRCLHGRTALSADAPRQVVRVWLKNLRPEWLS